VIISDVHRGTGDINDNFAPNQNIYFHALKHYYANGYTYIELGDGDELWENRKVEPIIQEHSHVFWLMNEFHKEQRLIMLYGNHDIIKSSAKWRAAHYSGMTNEAEQQKEPIFDSLKVTESIILSRSHSRKLFYVTHGHQSEALNSTFWHLGRFLVRHVWRPLESLGIKQPQGTAEQRSKMEKSELRLIAWCEKTGNALIAGHTHRSAFPNDGEPEYYNDGSCVHPRCITAIELTDSVIALVKWSVESRDDASLYIKRSLLEMREL